jgi:hypothetical protein
MRYEGDVGLGLANVGDVEHDAVDERTVHIADGRGDVPDPHDAAVLRDEAVLEGERSARLPAPDVLVQRSLPVRRVQVPVPVVRVGQVLLGRDAE